MTSEKELEEAKKNIGKFYKLEDKNYPQGKKYIFEILSIQGSEDNILYNTLENREEKILSKKDFDALRKGKQSGDALLFIKEISVEEYAKWLLES